MLRIPALALALLAATAHDEARRPAANITAEGTIAVTLPQKLIRSREVKEQLTSGLTTTFILSLAANDRAGAVHGGARLDVRLDLWEEKYLISIATPNGLQKISLDSEKALEEWWSENWLVVTAPRQLQKGLDLELRLQMLPFSAREQIDTERWLSRTLSSNRVGDGERTPAQSAEILRIIVETSVRRDPLLEYKWSVHAEPPKR